MKITIVKIAKSLVVTASALAALVMLGACGADAGSGDAAAQASERLSVVESDEAAGKLVLKYERDGRALTYDLRLGPEMQTPPSAEELALDPELPDREVDARVLDASGAIIYVQMGGDGFIDPTWSTPQVDGVDEAGRRADIGLLKAATSAFQNLEVAEGFRALRQTGVQISQAASTRFDTADAEPSLSTQSYLETAGTGVKAWDFQVRKHDLKKLGIKYGEHSAVMLRGIGPKDHILFTAVSCNHGACASASSMKVNCTSPRFKDDGTHSRFFYKSGCSTAYNWASSFNHHNCNDDSELQGRAVTEDTVQSTTDGSCSSDGLHNYAPGCSY